MKIEETLAIEIGDIEEDYSGQADEYRLQQIRAGLLSFVHRFVDEHSKSGGEADVLALWLALDLFKGFESRFESVVLRARLFPPNSPPEERPAPPR